MLLLEDIAHSLDIPSVPVNPLFRKEKGVVLVAGSGAPKSSSIDSDAYIATVYFDVGKRGESNALSSNPFWLPAPVVGQTPVSVIRSEGWVGRVQWRERYPDGQTRTVSGAFVDEMAYLAKIKWTQVNNQESKNVVINEVQMARGGYREGRYLDVEPKSVAANVLEKLRVIPINSSDPQRAPQTQVSPSSGSGQSALSVSHASPSYLSQGIGAPANEAKDSSQKIELPNLGGEGAQDPEPPVKKAQDSIGQGPNPQIGVLNGFSGGLMSLTPAGVSSMGPGSIAGGNPLSGMNNPPALGDIPMVNLGGLGAGASIGASATDIRFESKDYLAHFGLNYLSPGSSYGLGVKADGAYLLGKTVALSANLTVNNNMKEAVLSGVWMPEDTHLKAKLSASYMVGQQSFNFYSGNSNANLSQASFYFSTDYVVPKEQSNYLHSVGVSTWGSKASQTNNPDPVYSVVQTPTMYHIMMDPLKLAVGTLQGEALNAQVGLTKQVITKVSAGYESVKYPFSDGTQELDKHIYQDYVVQYRPTNEIALSAGYKLGAAMNNVMLSATYSQWKLTGYKNIGVNGVTGNQGIALTYSIPLDGSQKASAAGVLSRPELIGNSSYVLRDAITRPVQLPQAFLSKVDATAVKTVASINKLAVLPNSATVDAAGNVLVLIGVGGGAITQVTRNGTSYAYASTIQIAGTNLMIKTRALLAPASGTDAYVISITDSGGAPYLVNMVTQN